MRPMEDRTMRINEDTARKIKDAANVIDVISDFYELRKRGMYYECLCPFHEDRHLGSFKVSERHNTYTCFSCGAHGGPVDFIMQHERLSYPDALRWLGKKYHIEVEGADRFTPRPSKPHKPVPQLPMLILPLSYVTARMDTHDDTLCQWIRQLPWADDQKGRVEKVLRNYGVGHARQGHTIFWQIDERGEVRTGKMMLYREDGHRQRMGEGTFHWVHNLLSRAGKADLERTEFRTTMFGMHLLDYHPRATVNIVESEKTALLCAIYWGDTEQSLWMASGGLTFLTRDRLKPIIDRRRDIVLFPDKDGVERWRDQARIIGYDRMTVSTYYLDHCWQEADGMKADLGDIIVRSLTQPAPSATRQQTAPASELPRKEDIVLRHLMQKNPAIATLVDRLGCVATGFDYDHISNDRSKNYDDRNDGREDGHYNKQGYARQ